MTQLLESNAHLNVGRNTLHNGGCTIVATPDAPVSFGSFCAIGRNLTIMPINHDTNYPAVQGTLYRSMFGLAHPGEVGLPSRERTKGEVKIGNDVWIADNVTVLGGVDIGDGACIGAGSIVTRSVPPYFVAAGSPCRLLRLRFDIEMVRFLLALRWWDWPDDRIKRNREFFLMNLSNMPVVGLQAAIRD